MTYAQHGEDLLIAAFFERVGVTAGVFVDVGAGDGKTYSNTLLLEQAGWGGVLIEPDPRSAAKCRAVRAAALGTGRTRLYEVACVEHRTEERLPFYLATMPELSTLETGRDADIARIHAACNTPHTLIPTLVSAAPLADILDGARLDRIDLLSIDTEWRNAETVRGMDFARWQPRLVVVEANDDDELAAVQNALGRAGYTFAKQNINNFFFVWHAHEVGYL